MHLGRRPDDMKQIFFLRLATAAPNLINFYFRDNEEENYINISPLKYLNLVRMPQLQIEDSFAFCDEDLKIICEALPVLKVFSFTARWLKVTIDGGLVHLKQLKMLEYLTVTFSYLGYCYEQGNLDHYGEEVLQFCLLSMPKLKIIDGFALKKNWEDIHHRFDGITEPVEFRMESLRLKEEMPPSNVRLPHVKRLTLCWMNDVHFAPHHPFDQVKELKVYGSPSYSILLKILQHFGKQITTLEVCFNEGMLMMAMLDLCPLVKIVSIVYHDDIISNFVQPSCNLFRMKKFSLKPTGGGLFRPTPGLLRLLMTSCPDLEELCLGVIVSREEVDEVAAGFAAGAYPCALKLAKVSLIYEPPLSKDGLENLVRQVRAHCPKLEHIYVQGARKHKLGRLLAMLRKFDSEHVVADQEHVVW